MAHLDQVRRIGLMWRRAAALFAAIAVVGLASAAQARPLPEGSCVALRNGLEREFGIRPAFDVWTARNVDLRPLAPQETCRLSFRASGVQFETPNRRGFIDAVETMRGALANIGWTETPAQSPFAADGPLSTRFAVTKLRNVCVVEVSLQAAPEQLGAEPPDLAEWRIMAMRPTRRIYSFRLDCLAPETR